MLALSKGRDESDLDYVKRCLKRAEESKRRAEACDSILTALNYSLTSKRPVIKTATSFKVWWQIPGGYHPESVENFVLDREEQEMMRFYFSAEKSKAERAAEAYEADAVSPLNRTVVGDIS